jgi:hypothetical protein
VEPDINTFLNLTDDPELDPYSESFSGREWCGNLLLAEANDPGQYYLPRTAGVTFRGLDMFGFGTAADFQTTFSNIWLKVVDCVRSTTDLIKKPRIDILHDFEGMRPGFEVAGAGSSIAQVMFSKCLIFNGYVIDRFVGYLSANSSF